MSRSIVTYGNFHTLSADKFHAPHDVLLHLYERAELLRQLWAEGASGGFTESMTCTTSKKGRMLACDIAFHGTLQRWMEFCAFVG